MRDPRASCRTVPGGSPLFALLLLLLALLAGCATRLDASGRDGEVLVFAAASLTESFREIGAEFERRETATVTLNLGPSDGLASQIREGAPADVLASASQHWMDVVAADPGIRGRSNFAANRLVILVPLGNPAGIFSIEDLGRPGLKLVLAAAHVPVGTYARDALEAAGVLQGAEANIVSNEEDVKGVVQKVILGEADAGIAYVTDTTLEVTGRLETVEIRSEANPPVTYPIAAIRGSPNPGLALRFVGFVLTDGQAALRRHGFLPAH